MRAPLAWARPPGSASAFPHRRGAAGGRQRAAGGLGPAGRGRRPGARRRLEAGDVKRGLGHGGQCQPGHRAGVLVDHAPANVPHGGRRGQRRRAVPAADRQPHGGQRSRAGSARSGRARGTAADHRGHLAGHPRGDAGRDDQPARHGHAPLCRIFPIAVAGKTGTAQNEGELPHSWFVGYLPAENPEIAIVAMVENSGEGSAFAAPLFRQVAALYYGLEDEAPVVQGQGD